ncbi:MAG: T9SS type A sorting domain-containing protein, partial [Ignavibacteriaceae bacterium]
GKTILFFGECIRFKYWSAAPFNGGPASSLFMSQDIVAIESVLLDFLRSEGAVPAGTPDNYLHEAAQADNPPSGTVYDPENDGIPLKSLGVHEHWTNSTDNQYSRNLGTGDGIELVKVIKTTQTAVENSNADLPKTFALFANYPNPFNPITTIKYSMSKESFVTINVYDIVGREIANLVNDRKSAGNYSVKFYARNLPSGVYFYRMQAGSFVSTKKFVLLK